MTKAVSPMVFYAASRATNGIMALLTVIFFTRLLGREGYGQYALLMSFVGFISALGFQWIALSLGRFVPGAKNVTEIILSTRLLLWFSVLAITLLMLVVVAAFDAYSFLLGAIVLFAGISMGLFSIALQLENSKENFKRYALLTVLRTILTLLLSLFFLIYFSQDVGVLIFVMAGVATFLSAGLVKEIFLVKGKASKETSKDLMKYGLPLAISVLCILLIDYTDKWLIAYWLGLGDLGTYAAAYDITQQTVGATFNLFSLVLFPQIVRVFAKGNIEEAKEAGSEMFSMFLLASVFSICFTWVMADEISQILFPKDMSEVASSYLPWIVLAISISSLKTYCFDLGFKLERRSHSLLLIALLMVAVNTGANFYFIPRYGAIGGAFSTILAMIFGATLSYFFSGLQHFLVKNYSRDLKIISLCLLVVISAYIADRFFGESGISAILKIGFVFFVSALYSIILNISNIRGMLSGAEGRINEKI